MSNDLSQKEREALKFIRNLIFHGKKSPSVRSIMKALNYKSPHSAMLIINSLIDKKVLKRGSDGDLRIIDDPVESKINAKTINVPLVGCVACGSPLLAEENIEMTIPISVSLVKPPSTYFLLRAIGDSMNMAGINDGDLVLVRQQQTAENGDIVVALIDDEATVKEFYRTNDAVILKPRSTNKDHQPIILTDDFIIQGVVVKIIKNFEEEEKTKKQDIIEEEFTTETKRYIDQTDIKHRKLFGQYFTPRSVREALLNKLPNKINGPKALDPGCGTGEFLLTAQKYFKNPKLYGWDIDNKLTNIAKELVPKATFECTDALLNEDYSRYDFVIGNPPYFEFTPSKEIREKFNSVINGRVNIFNLFVYQGIKWLKDGGYLAYVIPPSMNNGAYFLKLRKFIVENANIEYLHVLDDPKMFKGALQSTMLLVLKKGKNKGDYLFKKNGILIFSEDVNFLKKSFENKLTLHDLGYEVKTGRLVWNQNKELLTNSPEESIPLIWAHNITPDGLKIPIKDKKKLQYVKRKDYDVGPAIIVNRITGTVKATKLKTAIVPPGMKFIGENHVNVIFPPGRNKQAKMELGKNVQKTTLSLQDIAKQLSAQDKIKVVRNITGNTQISKTELEKLFPINID